MFSGNFEYPCFQILRILSLLQSVNLDQQFLDSYVVVSFVMIYFFPLFKGLDFLLQFLDQNLVFFLVVLNVSVHLFQSCLIGFNVELDLVHLLVLIVVDIVNYLALELLKSLFHILRSYLLC